VQAVNASPTLPQPNPLTLTVEEPDVIGAVCGKQSGGGLGFGNKCTELISPCLLIGIPLQKTFPDP
jgi:hypothetical protein